LIPRFRDHEDVERRVDGRLGLDEHAYVIAADEEHPVDAGEAGWIASSPPVSATSGSRWRSIKISASFHHDSRCESLISNMARATTRKISFKPTSRRSFHLRTDEDRPGR
jgi:hypothetical protein